MADILIVAATEEEAFFLFKKKSKMKPGMVISIAAGSAHNIDLLITGPGITATTYFLTKYLAAKKYQLAINIGICGSVDSALKPVRVINIYADQFGDFGAEDNQKFKDAFDLGLLSENHFPFKKKKLHATFNKKLICLEALESREGVTVQKVTGSKNSTEHIKTKYGNVVESMEGAAFFYTCLNEKIPCLQIRSVSNMVEVRNRSKWKVKEAINALAGFTGLLLMELETKNI